MSNTRQFQQRSRGNGHVVALLVTAFSLAAALLLVLNRQYIVDQIAVWQYKPPAAVSQLADRSGMNNTGKFYFYTSRPAIEAAKQFNESCGRKEESTAILGCYNGKNIFIYNVANRQLDGIKEVTAAHEMLHAAYARLGDSEKKAVNKLLENEYAKLKSDKELAERFAFYDRTEPGERDNELHSIIGTEVATVNPALEQYYKKFFTDRRKVLALHDNYASVFAELQAKGESLSKEMADLKATITQESQEFNAEIDTLNADIAEFNQRANSDDGFPSKEAFDAQRASLVARASQLDMMRDTLNMKIATYNGLREELKQVVSQSEALNQSIDSSLEPVQSVTRP